MLRADGITDVQYVTGDTTVDNSQWLARGDTDFDMNMPSMHITSLEAGVPIKILGGVHFGCFELIANDGVRASRTCAASEWASGFGIRIPTS